MADITNLLFKIFPIFAGVSVESIFISIISLLVILVVTVIISGVVKTIVKPTKHSKPNTRTRKIKASTKLKNVKIKEE